MKSSAEKCRIFYRGPETKPPRVATDDENSIIRAALKDCFSKRGRTFSVTWRSKETGFKVLPGLSASLRSLKQKKTKALIYDDTTAIHLTKYLLEFSAQFGIPAIQARNLHRCALESKITSLLVVSFIEVELTNDSLSSNSLNKLVEVLELEPRIEPGLTFRLPVLDKVPSTGRSQKKKLARKSDQKE